MMMTMILDPVDNDDDDNQRSNLSETHTIKSIKSHLMMIRELIGRCGSSSCGSKSQELIGARQPKERPGAASERG